MLTLKKAVTKLGLAKQDIKDLNNDELLELALDKIYEKSKKDKWKKSNKDLIEFYNAKVKKQRQ